MDELNTVTTPLTNIDDLLNSTFMIDKILNSQDPLLVKTPILETNIDFLEKSLQKEEYLQLLTQEQKDFLLDAISRAQAAL